MCRKLPEIISKKLFRTEETIREKLFQGWLIFLWSKNKESFGGKKGGSRGSGETSLRETVKIEKEERNGENE